MFQNLNDAPDAGASQNEAWQPNQPFGGADFNNGQNMPEENDFETASVFERTVAFFIDLFIFILIFSLIAYFLGGFAGFSAGAVNVLYALGLNISFILYCTVFASGGRKTLGKFLLGIAVVDDKTGEGLTMGRAFFRALGYYLGFFTLFGGFALAFFNKKRRALEDLMGASRVISTREKSSQEATLTSILGTVLIMSVFIYLYLVGRSITGAWDAAAVANAQKQVDNIALLEEQHKKAYGFYTEDLVRLGLISGDAVQFQRDIQQNLKRRGFAIGTTEDGYKISGYAKDAQETPVFAEK